MMDPTKRRANANQIIRISIQMTNGLDMIDDKMIDDNDVVEMDDTMIDVAMVDVVVEEGAGDPGVHLHIR